MAACSTRGCLDGRTRVPTALARSIIFHSFPSLFCSFQFLFLLLETHFLFPQRPPGHQRNGENQCAGQLSLLILSYVDNIFIFQYTFFHFFAVVAALVTADSGAVVVPLVGQALLNQTKTFDSSLESSNLLHMVVLLLPLTFWAPTNRGDGGLLSSGSSDRLAPPPLAAAARRRRAAPEGRAAAARSALRYLFECALPFLPFPHRSFPKGRMRRRKMDNVGDSSAKR